MEVSSNPRVTGWQGAYVPQLKYRNPVPSDGGVPETQKPDAATANAERPSGSNIRDIRLSMSQQGHSEGLNPSPPRSLMPPSVENFSRTPPRKKSSMFGSIFAVKEPSQVALNQVAAQMMAQHGSTNARKVPNVSMEKMPQHVPKVNARWDGIPDAIKQREKREKDRARTATRDSMTSPTVRSRSSEQSRRALETRNSHNSANSLSDRTKSQHSNTRKHDSFAPNPHRFYAQSVNSSGDLAAQQRPEDEESRPSSAFSHPASLQSTSSKSLGEAGVFPDEIAPPLPKPLASHRRSGSQPKGSHKSTSVAPPVHAVPEQTRSPAATPRETSPITPPHQAGERGALQPGNLSMGSAKTEVVPPPATKVPIRPNNAFLAGEAQEFQVPDDDDNDDYHSAHAQGAVPPKSNRVADLEKRPDSSRDRLGLRANMVVKGSNPWDPRSDPYDRPPSADDRTNAQLKPKKAISKAFGSLLKREI